MTTDIYQKPTGYIIFNDDIKSFPSEVGSKRMLPSSVLCTWGQDKRILKRKEKGKKWSKLDKVFYFQEYFLLDLVNAIKVIFFTINVSLGLKQIKGWIIQAGKIKWKGGSHRWEIKATAGRWEVEEL